MELRILFIDDDIQNLEATFLDAIQDCKLQSVYYSNIEPIPLFLKDIEEKKILEFKPDIMVVDFDLRGQETGTAIFNVVKKNPFLRNSKIIMHTGVATSSEDFMSNGLIQGAFSYVVKAAKEGDKLILTLELQRAIKELEREKTRFMVGDYYTQPHLVDFFENETNIKNLYEPQSVNKAILFCDIANSSNYIQKLSIHKKVYFFRQLFDWWSELIIDKFHGWIDKFIGDEVNAYFGQTFDNSKPELKVMRENCINAITTALEIKNSFNTLIENLFNSYYALELDDYTNKPLGVKIIIHNENVLWGVFGSKKMMNLSILTDPLIKISRLMRAENFLKHVAKVEKELVDTYKNDHEENRSIKIQRTGVICVTSEVRNLFSDDDIFVFSNKPICVENCRDIPGPTHLWEVIGKNHK